MIEITSLAAKKLAAYLSANNIESPVRITAMNGCGGPSLGLALDEKKDGDHARDHEYFTLLIAADLSDSCGKVTVDYIEQASGCGCSGSGFSLTSEKPLPGSRCGGSSSSNGCCGC